MSRYRMVPSSAEEAVLRNHCGHARYVWNLAVERHAHWRPDRAGAPGYMEQCRQLTEAGAEHPWLAAGSQMVQQQALRDFAQVPKAGWVRFRWSRPVPHSARSYRVTMDHAGRWHITAGHAVTARGGFRDAGPANREPHLLVSLTGMRVAEIPHLQAGEGCQRVIRIVTTKGAGPPGPGAW